MTSTAKEAFEMMKGEHLGTGSFRSVYCNNLNPEQVLKIEGDTHQRYQFCNVIEWVFWNNHKENPKIAKWLAPCIRISSNGKILIQKRVETIPKGYELPKELPSFLTDLKMSNFGLLDGRLVCLDYGHSPKNIVTKNKSVDWCSYSYP